MPGAHPILAAQLAGRPLAPDVDRDDLAERMAGWTPATIERVVEAALLTAFKPNRPLGR